MRLENLQVQFAGTFQDHAEFSQVLRKTLEGKPEPLSALLLSDDKNGLHGTICLSDSRFVTGAEVKNADYETIDTGYEALKRLARDANADFKYITAPPAFFENTKLDLKIPIEKLLDSLPNLPEDIADLERTLTEPVNSKKKKNTWHSVPVSKTPEFFEQEEAEPRYVSIEERALAEIGPPSGENAPQKRSFIYKLFRRIGFFFITAFSAPLHMIKVIAKPVLLPLAVLGLLYQAYVFLKPSLTSIKLPAAPQAAKHTAPPYEHVVHTPVYRAPAPRRSTPVPQATQSFDSGHPYNPQAYATARPAAQAVPQVTPYETPTTPPIYPHRRAYQSASQQ